MGLKRLTEPESCMDDCESIKKKCADIFAERGSDIVEKLWSNKMNKQELTDFICKKKMKRAKGSCARKRLYLPDIVEEEEAVEAEAGVLQDEL